MGALRGHTPVASWISHSTGETVVEQDPEWGSAKLGVCGRNPTKESAGCTVFSLSLMLLQSLMWGDPTSLKCNRKGMNSNFF